MAQMNVASKIMVIRHGEKPPDFGHGINSKGERDNSSLAVQGWQRAGALAALFDPSRGLLQSPELTIPQFIYATAVAPHTSERPEETIQPLADKLGLSVITGPPPPATPFLKGDYAAMVSSAVASNGVVLICWQHEDIPEIANLILGTNTIPKGCWPGSRYDMVWVFDLGAKGQYQPLVQVPQLLLHGDSATPINITATAKAGG
jgi:hypothetical protein